MLLQNVLEPIPKIDRHIACDFPAHKCGLQ